MTRYGIKKLNITAKKLLMYGIVCLGVSISLTANADKLAPPIDLTFKDKANVDLLSGLPVIQQTDLKIGHEDLSLTHTLSSYAGYLSGFYDLSKAYVDLDPSGNGMNVKVRVGGMVQDFTRGSSNSPYYPLNNDGATLTGNSTEGYVYISNSGMRYHTKENKVVYPNGFTIYIVPTSLSNAVYTNNGLQFRYKRSPIGNGGTKVDSITAFNMAHKYCAFTNSNCSFGSEWPKSSYDWGNMWASRPVGQEYTITVTDAEGVQTKYVQKKYDMNYNVFTPPRIVRIYKNGAQLPTITYDYYEFANCSGSAPGCRDGRIIVDNANVMGVDYDYTFVQGFGQASFTSAGVSGSDWSASIVSTSWNGNRPRLSNSAWTGGAANYSGNALNRLTKLTDKGKEQEYEYDGRGNVTKLTQIAKTGAPGGTLSNVVMEAGYPSSCTESNYKYCNKPTWTKDAKGNVTNYYYHAPSGELQKMVEPADENGIRPTTFYTYTAKYARYYLNSGSTKVTASTPIWRLTETKTCRTKAALSNGCAANDALITRYEYNHDNLWLTSEISIASNGEQRRRCFEYDKLGNRIGETSPNANLISCP